MKEIKKWVIAYAKWNDSEKGGDDIFHRLYYSQKLAQYFVDERIFQLTEEEIKELLLCTNSMRVDQRNIPQIFKKNDLKFIKECLHFLIYGKSTLATRMTECKKIKNLGISTINEIVGLMNPNEYPIVNNNSISGMKFFGYELK
ncbi:MAG: hypothetical protein IPG55_16680 [Saprospiraceae bacterium]|nr:hypothetical protein [Candidatus Defluviibacterium haderslevense]